MGVGEKEIMGWGGGYNGAVRRDSTDWTYIANCNIGHLMCVCTFKSQII